MAKAPPRWMPNWSISPIPTTRWAATTAAQTLSPRSTGVPAGTLLVLDEAYIDLAPEGTAAPVSHDDPRVIRMRTFSKGYGMAGARVGYAIGAAPLIDAFNKVRNHFGMNRAALVGALAALQDQDWMAHVRAEVSLARDRIAQIARDNGLTPLPSATNFVTVDCGSDTAFARRVLEGLVARGVFRADAIRRTTEPLYPYQLRHSRRSGSAGGLFAGCVAQGPCCRMTPLPRNKD
jgi:histidinol-phosphate/aromatic aminotransferase/cobyric acid decarboxylase-like protein